MPKRVTKAELQKQLDAMSKELDESRKQADKFEVALRNERDEAKNARDRRDHLQSTVESIRQYVTSAAAVRFGIDALHDTGRTEWRGDREVRVTSERDCEELRLMQLIDQTCDGALQPPQKFDGRNW